MDDVAGRYSDWQDRQDKANREPDEVARDTVAEFLSGEFDQGYSTSMPPFEWSIGMFKEHADRLIESLKEKGFTITIRKEVPCEKANT